MKVPHAMNYGAGGYVAGHELSHGVDEWIRGGNPDEMNDHASCLINQLEEVIEPQTGAHYKDASGLLQEALADVGGINASFVAYRDASKGKDESLPGVNLTPDQLFFVAQANSWCFNLDDATIKNALSFKYGHPFNYHRVVVPAMNNPQFAKAYNCKKGTRMNPQKSCQFW